MSLIDLETIDKAVEITKLNNHTYNVVFNTKEEDGSERVIDVSYYTAVRGFYVVLVITVNGGIRHEVELVSRTGIQRAQELYEVLEKKREKLLTKQTEDKLKDMNNLINNIY